MGINCCVALEVQRIALSLSSSGSTLERSSNYSGRGPAFPPVPWVVPGPRGSLSLGGGGEASGTNPAGYYTETLLAQAYFGLRVAGRFGSCTFSSPGQIAWQLLPD